MSGKSRFGVPTVIFFLLLLGTISVLFFEWLLLFAIIPIFGYYIWQLREKNKQLETRLEALEGKPRQSRPDQN